MVKRIFTKKKAGLPPGTLIHVGDRKTEEVRIAIIDYDEMHLQEMDVENCKDCYSLKDTPTVTWINITGIHRAEVIKHVGEFFGIHSLVLEDIMNTQQRPKIDDYDTYLFIALKMLYFDQKDNEVMAEHVSILIGSNYVITFQECETDIFDPIRERIRRKKGRIRLMGADYLAYALIDTIVDNYFIIVEMFGERIEVLSEDVLNDIETDMLQQIYSLKREVIFLRKAMWPLRDVISCLERGESDLVNDKTLIFFRDVYDHIVHIIETLELSRETISTMIDIYLSHMSNGINEVMKTLTIVATLFIPLTFIAGIYGMNFKYMPEIEWHWGYPTALLLMAAIGVGMLLYFRRKKWF
jgi:magnesium transporter